MTGQKQVTVLPTGKSFNIFSASIFQIFVTKWEKQNAGGKAYFVCYSVAVEIKEAKSSYSRFIAIGNSKNRSKFFHSDHSHS